MRPRLLTLRWDKPDPPVPWDEVEVWRKGEVRYDEGTTARLLAWYETTRRGGWNRWVEIAPDFKTFAKMVRL